ncbi:hypothetical protein TWF191_005571 [Orbilia oligospora]|uniref:Uncharacterized protein n=1 Tax=Orbilia oligospora TaxID=2813651 RepID=A0A7C8V3B8_ORBOL|nr:hypothetical protein TWF191_005571 [Orbilia oligospora]
MSNRNPQQEAPGRISRSRQAIKKVFTALLKPNRSRSRSGDPSLYVKDYQSPVDRFPDVPPACIMMELLTPRPNNDKPSKSSLDDTRASTSGDMTIETLIQPTRNLDLINPKIQSAAPTSIFPQKVVQQPVPVPEIKAQSTATPERPKSLMGLAGAKRDSDIIYPPFNLWKELVKNMIRLGVEPQTVSPMALFQYVDIPERQAPWYEPAAIDILTIENNAYKVATDYVIAASGYVIRPHSSAKKVMAWTQLGDFDFRLGAIDTYADNLIRDVNTCREKCGDTLVDIKMAINASNLVEVLLELKQSVADLREAIMYRIIRRHDDGKASVWIS